MFSFKCEKCGNRMVNDAFITVKNYDFDVDAIINKEGKADTNLLPDYLVFICKRCGNMEKTTFEEVQLRLKESFMKILLRVRFEEASLSVDKSKILEENGIDYCGKCPGPLDGDGYCFKDVKLQCIINKRKYIN